MASVVGLGIVAVLYFNNRIYMKRVVCAGDSVVLVIVKRFCG